MHTLCLLFACKQDFKNNISLQPRTRGVWGFKILGCSLIKEPSWPLTQASCSGLHYEWAQLGCCQAHCQAPLGHRKQFIWGGTRQEAVQWGVLWETDTTSSWLLYQYQGPPGHKECGSGKTPGTLPQMSREIKMLCAQRQSSAVFRQMDLGGILGVESIFQAASAVACGLVSKLPGKHLHISSVLVLLPITFWGFYYVMIYLANVTSPTATSNVIKVKPWASNISQIMQVMSARWARTSTRGNN